MNNIQIPVLTTRFQSALVYASQLHAFQVRKGSNIPYISHLLSVSALVLEMGGNEDEAIAALLHDAIEDQGGNKTRDAIRQHYGETVAEIVEGCTECDTDPKPPWQARKERYLQHLQTASPSVLRVSLADKLHNIRSIVVDAESLGNQVWQKFQGGREGTLWYYQSLLAIYQQTFQNAWTKELGKLVQILEIL